MLEGEFDVELWLEKMISLSIILKSKSKRKSLWAMLNGLAATLLAYYQMAHYPNNGPIRHNPIDLQYRAESM